VESDDHGKRHWLWEPITKPNWNSYSDAVTKHIPDINSNANTSDAYTYTNAHGDTHSDTTNHTYSNAGYTYSDPTVSNPDTNATANADPNSKSNTCRAGPQPLDSDAGSDWR
jgi:hypothetical protein